MHAHLIGEDHTEFTVELDAETLDEAYAEIDLLYPEAAISDVFDPVDRANAVYARARRMYDDGYYGEDY